MGDILAERDGDGTAARWLRWAVAYAGGFVGAMLDQRRRAR